MGKRVIQVPIDEALLLALDKECQEAKVPRAELIRKLWRAYLRGKQIERMDAACAEGCRRIPERAEEKKWAEISTQRLADFCHDEKDW